MHRPHPTIPVNGAAIRTTRLDAGLSTAETARRAGISDCYLRHLETGYRDRMGPGRYAALRKALGLPASDRRLLTPAPPEDHAQEQ
ncbi:helix-turn-helix domain-containing protein [Streptomyces sp. NPDC048434]|uniref:helix-turn-helix domain-containing protein n=1 Tax=Streptomyces sp. NPDC048434 TaxID=3365549 RepID=UPI0037182241